MNGRIEGAADPAPGPADAAGRATRWWVIVAVLLLLASGLVIYRSLQASRGPQAGPAALSETLEVGSPQVRDASQFGAPSAPDDGRPGTTPSEFDATPAPVGGMPVALRIPALGLEESLITLGLNPDGTVEVPTDYSRAGWYEFGPSPGERGSAVILGHVDSFAGPAVFHRLRELETDDVVEVGLADGRTAHFAVTAVETYPKVEFPAERVYGSYEGESLQLVTCGGDFDAGARSYLSNVVAFTSLVGITPPGS